MKSMTETVAPAAPTLDAAAVLAAALKLPTRDRERLAEQLWASVDDEHRNQIVDGRDLLGPGWMEEIERRLEEIRRGEAVLIDGKEVMSRLRAKYAS